MPAEPINYSKDLVNGVAEFDIQLARDTLILTSDPTELEINPDASRLSGKVILTLTEPLRDVKSVEFRFVGGVVSKLEYDPVRLTLFPSRWTLKRNTNIQTQG